MRAAYGIRSCAVARSRSYGAGGAVGAAVATAFACDGARVALTGRSPEPLEALAAEIDAAGGRADVAVVDGFDEEAVDSHLLQLVEDAGGIDISFNPVSLGYVIGEPVTTATSGDFTKSIERAMRTHFVTAIAADRQMVKARSGAILTIVASPSRVTAANQGTLSIVGAATEALCRQLSVDLGPDGAALFASAARDRPTHPASTTR